MNLKDSLREFSRDSLIDSSGIDFRDSFWDSLIVSGIFFGNSLLGFLWEFLSWLLQRFFRNFSSIISRIAHGNKFHALSWIPPWMSREILSRILPVFSMNSTQDPPEFFFRDYFRDSFRDSSEVSSRILPRIFPRVPPGMLLGFAIPPAISRDCSSELSYSHANQNLTIV